MRYAQVRNMDIINGNGIGVALFTQGCRFHCKNCFNMDLWNFDGGKEWTEETKDKVLSLVAKPYITRFSVLGGEPLSKENIDDLLVLLKTIKEQYPDKQIWVYTGYAFEEIPKLNYNAKDLLPYIDTMVDGLYIDELKDLTLSYRGSSNQRVIDVQQSLQMDEIVKRDVEK